MLFISVFLFILGCKALTFSGSVPGLSATERSSVSLSLRDLNGLHTDKALLDSNNTFNFYNLNERHEYIVSLDSSTVELKWSYLVRIKDGSFDVHVLPQNAIIAALGPAQTLPLEITGLVRPKLVPSRPSFSVFKFLISPTVLLSIVALLFIVYVPFLLNNLDPEVLDEMRRNQLQGGQMQDFDLASKIADFRVNNGKKKK